MAEVYESSDTGILTVCLFKQTETCETILGHLGLQTQPKLGLGLKASKSHWGVSKHQGHLTWIQSSRDLIASTPKMWTPIQRNQPLIFLELQGRSGPPIQRNQPLIFLELQGRSGPPIQRNQPLISFELQGRSGAPIQRNQPLISLELQGRSGPQFRETATHILKTPGKQHFLAGAGCSAPGRN